MVAVVVEPAQLGSVSIRKGSREREGTCRARGPAAFCIGSFFS